jgi:hypothetical protein
MMILNKLSQGSLSQDDDKGNSSTIYATEDDNKISVVLNSSTSICITEID